MFKDKSKLNVQNPVVGSLIMQVADNEKKEKEIFRALDQALPIKGLDIEKRFCDLKNFNEGRNNDDDDDNNNNIGQSPGGNLPPSQTNRRTITSTYTANFTSDSFKCNAKIFSSPAKSS